MMTEEMEEKVYVCVCMCVVREMKGEGINEDHVEGEKERDALSFFSFPESI